MSKRTSKPKDQTPDVPSVPPTDDTVSVAASAAPQSTFVNLCEFTNEHFHTSHILQPLSDAEKAVLIQNTLTTAGLTLGDRTIIILDVRILDVDVYQRHEMPNADMGRLIPQFDINKAAPIYVAYRDGHFVVVEGSHRAVGGIANGEKHLFAIIVPDTTQQSEADMFVHQDDNKTTIKAKERFNAGRIALTPCDVAIQKLCDKYTISVFDYDNSVVYQLSAVAAARKIVTSYGEDTLDWALSVLHDAGWLTQKNGTIARYLDGLVRVYVHNNKNGDLAAARAKIIDVMTPMTPDGFGHVAQAVGTNKEVRSAVHELFKNIINDVYVQQDLLPLVPERLVKQTTP